MKTTILGSSLLFALGSFAQQVRIVSPTPNTRVVAGQPLTVTVAFTPTTSSVDVIALILGAKANDPEANSLGQTRLATFVAPEFPISGPTGHQQNLQVTFPVDIINGLNKTYNLTCGEFYTLGAENIPLTFTSQVPVFVASA